MTDTEVKIRVGEGNGFETLTHIVFDDTTGRVLLKSKHYSVAIKVDALTPAEDCSESHKWGRWQLYISSSTDWSFDEGYRTVNTQRQKRQCINCGFTEDVKVGP